MNACAVALDCRRADRLCKREFGVPEDKAQENFTDPQSRMALEQLGIEALVGLGREGKAALNLNAERFPASARMAQRLNTPAGRARYRRRKVIPEPVFGWIKPVLGFRRFSLRGLHKVTAEWNLVCLAVNLKRMQVLLRPA